MTKAGDENKLIYRAPMEVQRAFHFLFLFQLEQYPCFGKSEDKQGCIHADKPVKRLDCSICPMRHKRGD